MSIELGAQGQVDVNVKPLVVVQEIWIRTSSDYDAVKKTRTLVVAPETTVGEVMTWASAGCALGRGDVLITVSTPPA